MKSNVLDNEVKLRHYLEMALAEASDLEARALEQDWINNDNPSIMDLQMASFALYTYHRPLTPESFKKILERIKERNTNSEKT